MTNADRSDAATPIQPTYCSHCGCVSLKPDARDEALLWAYQAIGALWPNREALDNLSAAGRGKPIPHEWPVVPPDTRDQRIAELEAILTRYALSDYRKLEGK